MNPHQDTNLKVNSHYPKTHQNHTEKPKSPKAKRAYADQDLSTASTAPCMTFTRSASIARRSASALRRQVRGRSAPWGPSGLGRSRWGRRGAGGAGHPGPPDQLCARLLSAEAPSAAMPPMRLRADYIRARIYMLFRVYFRMIHELRIHF